ncbi:MAG: Fic family protein [Bacteroidaceae bacterium]|nr:Fic family protein [Bacteroidaceae bacterium]MBR3732965.1 Fic family protein [Bacteroidaceae bacterium]
MEKIESVFQKWQSLQPLSDTDSYRLSKKFTVEYNYNSNHIEGNTLTYGQTELLLLFGKVSGEGELKDFADMKASQVGLKLMMEEVATGKTPLTQNFIRQLHKTLLREDYTVYRNLPGGIQTSFVIHAGQYKTRPNSVITRYGDRFDYASPEETPALMADLVDWYNEAEQSGKYSPVELAALFHYRYIRIHPFEDGNGRIARLMVNYILARHGWPMIVVRSRKKDEYLEALRQTDIQVGSIPAKGAHAPLGKIKKFLTYFTKLVATEMENEISFIKDKGEDVWWYDGERIKFRSANGPKILHLIDMEPDITYASLSEKIGVNVSALQKQLENMTKKGYIQRRENGDWHVFATSSV